MDTPETWLASEDARLNEQGHPDFFAAVERGEVRREELAQALLQRYELSHVFNDILAELLDCLKRDSVALEHPLTRTLQENLNEELGQAGTPYGNFLHSNSRSRLVNALGHDYEAWGKRQGSWANPGVLSPKAATFLEGHRQLLAGPVTPAYAAMTYWEWRVSREGQGDYRLFLDAFERLYPELKRENYAPSDPLWHLYSHSVHDDEHAAAFLKALSTSDPEPVLRGFGAASQLWDQFWNFPQNT